MVSSRRRPRWYCPGDETLSIDLSFDDQLKNRFDAPGDFAQAYVIAHEVGHHVQNLLGAMDFVHAKKGHGRPRTRRHIQRDFAVAAERMGEQQVIKILNTVSPGRDSSSYTEQPETRAAVLASQLGSLTPASPDNGIYGIDQVPVRHAEFYKGDIRCYWERLEPILIYMPKADSLVMLLPARHMGHGQALPELTKITVSLRPEHKVPMIRQQAVAQTPHGEFVQRLLDDSLKSLIVFIVEEEWSPTNTTID